MAQEISDGIIAFLHLSGRPVQINSGSLETGRCCYPVTPPQLFEMIFFGLNSTLSCQKMIPKPISTELLWANCCVLPLKMHSPPGCVGMAAGLFSTTSLVRKILSPVEGTDCTKEETTWNMMQSKILLSINAVVRWFSVDFLGGQGYFWSLPATPEPACLHDFPYVHGNHRAGQLGKQKPRSSWKIQSGAVPSRICLFWSIYFMCEAGPEKWCQGHGNGWQLRIVPASFILKYSNK